MLKPPASAIGAAPRVMASRGALVALVLKDLDPGMVFVLKIKVDGTYTTVGTVTGQGSGQLLLPVMRFDAVQTYVLALVNPSGVPFYVKVVVT